MAEQEVVLKFRVRDDGSLALFDAAGRKLDNLGTAAEHASNRGASAFSRFGAGVIELNQALDLARRGFEGIKRATEFFVGQAEESAREVALLNSTLKSLGANSQVSQQMQTLAKAMQAVTTASDEEIMRMERLLYVAGIKAPKDMEFFIRAIAGLSRFMGRDLVGATEAVAMVLQGNFMRAQMALRMNINENATATEKYMQIMQRLQQLMSSEDAYVRTFGGSMEQLGHLIGDVAEEFGKTITESSALQDVLALVKTQIRGVATAVEQWVQAHRSAIDAGIREFFEGLPNRLSSAATSMGNLATKMGEFADQVGRVVEFFQRHPEIAGALGGAWVGARVGSVVPGVGTGIGAAAGGAWGYLGGLYYGSTPPNQSIGQTVLPGGGQTGIGMSYGTSQLPAAASTGIPSPPPGVLGEDALRRQKE